ncbi:transcription-repair coupling factor [Borrelia hermsii]|uniref:Transcription-repair-coupling factor n=3 Tax=Borrelia hermsii TaxID=140 RepID=A0AAN1CEM1_BORHE|nr:transcription-repair coupling factor [Borrelia hermsii]AAX17125.1 transcription-repair coupling factor [Borrelia hermsii DAH]AJW73411.1 transcription-repair coupling factor [Borrelia hermsii CC1]AMR75234.1 transcription-repair coupling factor / Nucleotide Excision Repair NER [Borrelia hermsii]ANA43423.1 transcription-repair coupling factor [Borrelia hermsii HS1]UCP01627.1 transcription-repair coupling factor [Borrelia hermsii]
MNIEKELTTILNDNQNLKKIQQLIKENLPFTLVGHGGFFEAFLINKIKEYSGNNKIILIVNNENIADALKDDLMQITDKIYELNYFSPLVYKGIGSKSTIFSERIKFLINFYENNPGIYIVLLKSLLSKIPTKENLFKNIYKIQTSKLINIKNLESKLIRLGYEKTMRVTLPGEFTIKGEIIDIHSFNKAEPIRISLHNDTIKEIKYFNPLTQLKKGNEISEFDIIPKKEIIWNNESINRLKHYIKENEYKKLFEQIETKYHARAEEIFYPLIGDTYLSQEINEDTLTINFEIPNLQEEIKKIYKEYEKLYSQAIESGEKTIAPKEIFINLNDLKLKTNIFFVKTPANTQTEELVEFEIESGRRFFSNIALAKEEIQNWLNNGFKVIIAAESSSQKEKLKYIFKDLPKIKIEVLKISSSLIINKEKIAIILESDIFNRRQKINKVFESSRTKPIDSFIEVEKNSHVVHINHGIGIFKQIKRIKTSLLEKDYIEIEYADNEKLFIPIEQTHLIQRYIGNENQNIKLDKISSKTWEKKKANAKKRIDAIADQLVSLYSARESTKGFQYPQDNEWQLLFESEFAYDETPDQLTAISEIKQDMMSLKVMDRLLCGDVGFGKTEVAMRAAFKAVMGTKQVAILSPTTILAEQHFNTFKKRFKNFPIKIAMMSRFIKKSKEREIIKNLATGEIDIIIGTHKILSKKIIYKNLGLIIIDEEQRFGVREKEKLKEIKVSVDCLTLSATPIPRSLHMSLIKLRDISVLKTPPQNRIKIETYVEEFSELLIKHAIEHELSRDGQVFFVHHNIQELDLIKAMLEKVVPYARIATIHARLTGDQIENIMHDFINKSYQVLLSTTIIENGIDIENANTIIINNANRFGLAQLYQLRGRVGRSSQKAFAYFLYKESSSLNESAIERLRAISEFSELGAGFQIAMKDMEIRGVGNLLGKEQHGEIESIGLDYYLTMLNKAIEKRMGKNSKEDEITIEINYNGFIPDSYVNNEQDKISIYKKISAIQSEEENNKIRAEIHDRFGSIPEELNTLLILSELKLLAKKLNITSLKEKNGLLEIEYLDIKSIPVYRIMQIIKDDPTTLKINPKDKKSVFLNLKNVKESEKINCIYRHLNLLL